MVAGGKEKVLKFFDMQNLAFQGNSNMTPSEIKTLRYNHKGTKVYVLGQKFLWIFTSMDSGFKSIENIEVPSTLIDVVLT